MVKTTMAAVAEVQHLVLETRHGAKEEEDVKHLSSVGKGTATVPTVAAATAATAATATTAATAGGRERGTLPARATSGGAARAAGGPRRLALRRQEVCAEEGAGDGEFQTHPGGKAAQAVGSAVNRGECCNP